MGFWVICVAYNNHEEVIRFVQALKKMAGDHELKIAIVDNTEDKQKISNKELVGKLKNESGNNCYFIESNKNLGYFGGMNLGYEYLLECSETPADCIVLTNTDIEFASNDFFSNLSMTLSRMPSDCGVVAPSIISTRTNKNQNPMYINKPSKIKFEILSFVFSYYLLAILHRLLSVVKGKIVSVKTEQATGSVENKIYAAHGACMIFRNVYFSRGGSLKFPEFLFCEEIFVAEECVKNDLSIMYCPEVVVMHKEHATTHLIPSRLITSYLKRSHQYCLDAYYKS